MFLELIPATESGLLRAKGLVQVIVAAAAGIFAAVALILPESVLLCPAAGHGDL